MKAIDSGCYRAGPASGAARIQVSKGARWRNALLALVMCLGPGSAWALSSDKDQPVLVEADSADIDDAKNISVYSGNVEIQQGSLRILADKVTVYHEERTPQRIVAEGQPVKYRQLLDGQEQEVKARALRMEYDVDGDELLLIEQAELRQGRDSFRSDRIVYDRKQAVVKAGASAKGQDRVRVIFNPSDR